MNTISIQVVCRRPFLLAIVLMTNPAIAAPMDCLAFDGFDGGRAPTQEYGASPLASELHAPTAESRPVPAMRDLRWDAAVALSAQGWADQCNYSHPGGHGYGENLAMGSGVYPLDQLTTLWIEEFVHYNYAANTCAAGRQCGHYTQVVWRDSQRIGCGARQCPNGPNVPFAERILACRYDPAGNSGGLRPY